MKNDQERIALGRLALIRKLISLAHVYEHDKELFYKKFVETVDTSTLRKHEVIEMVGQDQNNLPTSSIEPKDVELFCLKEQGFTTEELCVIFGLKNPNSLYVKLHKLRKKLNQKVNGSASPVSLVLGVAFLLLISIIVHIIK